MVAQRRLMESAQADRRMMEEAMRESRRFIEEQQRQHAAEIAALRKEVAEFQREKRIAEQVHIL